MSDHPVPLPEQPPLPERLGTLQWEGPVPVPAEAELPRSFSWTRLGRHWLLITACVAIVVIITVALTRLVTPEYEASATLLIDDKQPNLPDVFRRSSEEGELATDMEVLKSETLREVVTDELGLRLELLAPQRTSRDSILTGVTVSRGAKPREYLLRRGESERFEIELVEDTVTRHVAQAGIGDSVRLDDVVFQLAPGAAAYEEIRLAVRSRDATLEALDNDIEVSRPSRDAQIVEVSYRSPEPDLAWRVPDVLVRRFIEQRRENQKIEVRSTVGFLKTQIESLAKQLASAEQQLLAYREASGVIQPQAEATSQVNRLVTMQTERGMLEAQRAALASLMREVDVNAASQNPEAPSPYRRLMAFPALLQSQAAAGLLQALTRMEDERKALLVRRTPEDSDVQALTNRIGEVEQELRAVAAAYLQSVTHQVSSVDAGLEQFQRQLRAVPQRELRYARLEREPKVLGEIYTMLQTRLKEAEIAAASQDPSVRIVDLPRRPARPVWPKPGLNLAAGVLCGLLLGIAASMQRERLDKSVRSRADVHAMTGLQVLGLIPHIRHQHRSIPLIAERAEKVKQAFRSLASSAAGAGTRRFTFLGPTEAPSADCAGLPAPGADTPVFTLTPMEAAVAAAYGSLETNVAFSRQDVAVKVIVVTSALAGEGKSTTAVNFGLALAQRGLRVALVDADLRRGRIHDAFGAERAPGLIDLLRGTASFESACRVVTVGDGTLHYLATGRAAAADIPLAASAGARQLLGWLRERFDVVIVDTPPVNLITDAAVLSTAADGVLLIARTGLTDAGALRYAVEQLRHVRAPLLGVVLNDIDLRRDAAYDGVYRYFQDYEYTAPTGS